MEISENLSDSWLKIVGIDSTKFRIVLVDEELKLASGSFDIRSPKQKDKI